jgi:hypothetical protein
MTVTSQQAAESTHRRRLGALAALGLGLFLGLTLIPFPLTPGSIGSAPST